VIGAKLVKLRLKRVRKLRSGGDRAAGTEGARAHRSGESGDAARSPGWSSFLAAAVIVSGGVLAYSNSFQGTYIYDDVPAIPQNPQIRSLWPITEAMSAPPETTVKGRPIVSLSLAINYAISGLDVRSYHAFNLTVHLIAGLLLFGIIRRTLVSERLKKRFAGVSTLLGGICALVWVVHPLNTQAVTYIIQRAESMMGMFYLLTLYCAIRGFASKRPAGWYIAAVAACALGMGTKEVMLTAPAIVLGYDRIFVSRSFKAIYERRSWFYIALMATWVILAALIITEPRGQTAGFGMEHMTPTKYLKGQFQAVVRYIRLAFWPNPLVLDYGQEVRSGFADYAPQGAVLLCLLGATVVALRYHPALGFLGMWFFVILSPTSSFVPIADPAYEHRMYLPLAGIVVLVIAGAFAVGRGVIGARLRAKILGVAAVAALTAVLVVLTRDRNRDYFSETSMWEATVESAPNNPRAHHNLGVALFGKGEQDRAIAHFDEAVRLKDDYPEAYCQRGAVYAARGDLDLAVKDLDKAIELLPGYPDALHNRGAVHAVKGDTRKAISDFTEAIFFNRTNPRYYLARASAYRAQGDHDSAIGDVTEAIRLRPRNPLYYVDRASVYEQKGDYDSAIRDLDKAMELNRFDGTAYVRKGNLLTRQGRYAEVIAHWRAAVRAQKGSPFALNALAWVLATNEDSRYRDADEAVALAERACELTEYKSPGVLDTLGAAYAAAGRFDDAVRAGQKACDLVKAGGEETRVTEMRKRLDLYRSARAYREPRHPSSAPAPPASKN